MSPSAMAVRPVANTAARNSASSARRRSILCLERTAASARIDLEAPVADALAIGGGELVDQGAAPDLLQIGGELELVQVADAEAAGLAPGVGLHLVLDLLARLARLVVGDQDRLLVQRAAADLVPHHVGV